MCDEFYKILGEKKRLEMNKVTQVTLWATN